MAVNIGPKIGIDGEAQFRKEINGIIQQSKTLASEMKAVTSAFDANDKSQEALAAQTKVLTKQIETQQQRVSKLTDGLNAAAKQFGENDTRTQKWQQAVNEATAELNRMKSQLSGLDNSVKDVGSSMQSASKETLSFGEILKANLLSQVIVEGVKQIADAIRNMAGEFVNAAADVKAEASQFTQTFGDMKEQAEQAIDGVADSAGILDTRLKTVGTQIYAFAKASGGDAAQSMDIMRRSLQAVADGAAYYDKSLEETAESLQSFLKGNYENDAALGLSATETTRNAAAMELFGEKFNDLSEIQKQQTLLQMVLDAQELSGAMGQASREADGWSNVQGNLNEAWRQFMAAAGEPFLQNLVPVVQEITDKLIEMTQNIDWDAFAQQVTGVAEEVLGFVQTIIENKDSVIAGIVGIGTAFATWNVVSIIQKVVESYQAYKAVTEGATIAQWALNAAQKANPMGIFIGVIAGLIAGLVTLWNTNEGFRNWVIEAGQQIAELVSGVVNSVVLFFTETIPQAFEAFKNKAVEMWEGVKNKTIETWNEIKNKVVEIWDGIKTAVSETVDAIVSFFTETIPNAFNTVIEFVKTNWQGLLLLIVNPFAGAFKLLYDNFEGFRNAVNSLVENIKQFFSDLATSIANTVGGIRDSIVSGIGKAVDFITGLPGKALQWGKDFIQGFIDGITSMIDGVVGAVSGIADTISSWLHFSRPDVGPLRQYESWMPDMMQGMAKGIRENSWRLEQAMNAATSNLQANVNINGMTAAGGGMNMGGVSITINPAPGMDVDALADAVAYKLQAMTQRKAATW